MVCVSTVSVVDMKCDARALRESLKELSHKFCVKGADFFPRKVDIPDEEWPAGHIDCRRSQRFIHRKIKRRIACNATTVAQRIV